MVVGGAIGMVAGYVGGRVDLFTMQVMDVLLSFPSLILGLIVVALLGPDLVNIILAIALTAIAPFARIARAPTLALKERAFVEAGRALGFSHARILFVHILPNILSEVLVMGIALAGDGGAHGGVAVLHRPRRQAADRRPGAA